MFGFPQIAYAIDVVGSNLKDTPTQTKNSGVGKGYGQGGWLHSSSDLPGEHTGSGFLPRAIIPATNLQLRPYSNEQKVPTAFGMRSRQNSGERVPAARRRDTFGTGQ
jgi:hypothetical protein